ncbi:MAG: DUF5605 domain-containing protein [Anaerolineaceae bacterium]|nr:DUF5605 domain-containing protein [Anaerolineaceae bacterium]
MTQTVEQWDVFEQAFLSSDAGNPDQDISLEAQFTHQDRIFRVEGFYDGNATHKIRFMPDQPGEWTFTTSSNHPALNGQTGRFQCAPAKPNNHGPVRVANQVHFAYADGTPYIPVGTTCYVWNLQGDELEEQTLASLENAPFNKMRMCVFPKRYRFNHNEPPCYPYPGEVTIPWDSANLDNLRALPAAPFWDFERFNPVYFQHLEQRIRDLRDRGIEADLILFHPYDFGAWGFDRLPPAARERLLRHLVARLSTFRNLWWSFANEYDFVLDRSMEDWDHDMQLVQTLDPYNHLRSIHNCFTFYDHSKPWVTHCSIQHGHLDLVPVWLRQYAKPVVVDECGYEGDIPLLWGDLSPEELVTRFWIGFTSGGYVGHGETYLNDREELWWSKGGKLVGQSTARIAFLREIIEQAPGGLLPLKQTDGTQPGPAPELFDHPEVVRTLIPEGLWNMEAGGYYQTDYFLLYFGMHQPRLRNFNLPEGRFQIDVIDTWNMTIQHVAERAHDKICVDMPTQKYMAIRIQRVD